MPKTHIFRVIRKGEVRVNGKRAKPDAAVAGKRHRARAAGADRRCGAAAPRARRRWSQGLTGAIVYEDPRLLVIDKPAGVAVHGGSGVSFGVIEALRAARPDETLELVHRIDRDTSGLLLVARKPAALRTLHALHARGQGREALSRAGEGQVGARARSASTCRCARISAWAASAR